MAEEFAGFDLGAMSKTDGYKLLASVILPRPIAWVVSRDVEGVLNAAPFSFLIFCRRTRRWWRLGFRGRRIGTVKIRWGISRRMNSLW